MPKLKDVRQELGLSQTKMGELMGMRQPEISRIELGPEGGGPKKSGRGETKIQKQFLKALLILGRNGLLHLMAGEVMSERLRAFLRRRGVNQCNWWMGVK